MKPQIIRAVQDLRKAVKGLRKAVKNSKIALVPTMGALHRGHLTLVDEAKKLAEKVVVSIFVNPKQFGEGEDFDAYPKTENADITKLEDKADIIYIPSANEMYPQGFATTVSVDGSITDCLCGKSRPTHFDGVATVVTKLFAQVMPDIALFGEKDYQQLQVIKQFTTDLNLPIEIVGVPIVREKDGLALSSRNRYLSKEEREKAPYLYKSLCNIKDEIIQNPKQVNEIIKKWGKEFDKLDYLELRNANNLELMSEFNAPARLFIAVFLENCRLIDNIAV